MVLARPLPGDIVFVEPHPRRVQALRGGRMMIDTERALLVHRRDSPLSYAFPAEEVGDLPSEPVAEAPGFVSVPWDAVDTWLEEGRRLVHYPPNPYHRVDCRPTNRGLRVTVAGTVLVDTAETIIVFETSVEPRLYVAPSLVRTDALRRSANEHLLQLQGSRDVLVGGDRRRRHTGRGVELPGSAARNPAHQGIFQLRLSAFRGCGGTAEVQRHRLRLRGMTRVTSARATIAPYGFVTVGYGCVRFPARRHCI